MKLPVFKRLRTKILLAMVAIVLLGFAATVYVITERASDLQRTSATQYAEVLAEKNAADTRALIESAMNTARTLAHSLEGLKSRGFANRSQADAMLHQVLDADPQLLGAWSIWEPNAFDGNDRRYAGSLGSNQTGRYMTSWYRNNRRLTFVPLHAKAVSDASNEYAVLKRSGRELITEPFRMGTKGPFVTRLEVPIQENGKFVGVAGVDLPLTVIQASIDKIKPYGIGYAHLISYGGVHIGHVPPHALNKHIASSKSEEQEKAAIRAGRIYRDIVQGHRLGTDVYSVYVPISIGQTQTPWSFAITVPMDRVLANVRTLRNIALGIGLASIVVLITIITLVLNRVVNRPLITAMAIAKRLSEGDLDTPVEVKSNDEMGRLLGTMRIMAGRLSQLRRIETELTVERTQTAIARQIQQSLFPAEPPKVEGVSLAGRCIPAAQIGGDYLDYFQRSEDTVDIFISDVSGHGIGSALLMAEARSIVRSSAYSAHSASEMLARLNQALFTDLDRAEQFITMFYAKYCTKDHLLAYASAGHNPPLIIHRKEKACAVLDAEGLVVGIREEVYFEEKKIQLEQDDLVFFYTDGVTEAQSPAAELYGMERLCSFLAQQVNRAPAEIIEAVVGELHYFCQCPSFADDVTMIAMKVA